MAKLRKRDPEKMKQISSFVEEYFFEYHQSPSMQKIADTVGVSKSTAYYYVNEMAEKGMLDYDGKTIETRRMRKSDYSLNRAPVLGSVVCGSPELAEEDFEEFVALPVALFGQGDFFVLHTHGDSMIDAGIDEGDMVVVKKQNYADYLAKRVEWISRSAKAVSFIMLVSLHLFLFTVDGISKRIKTVILLRREDITKCFINYIKIPRKDLNTEKIIAGKADFRALYLF